MIKKINIFSWLLHKESFLLLLIGIALIIFINPFSLYFLNDDLDSLPYYATGGFFSHGGMRITEKASNTLDIWLYQMKPFGYIFTNLFIHISTCIIGCWWLKMISNSFGILLNKTTAICIALLFMWYAFHTEAVVWAICRTASLSLLFFLLAWLCVSLGAKNNLYIWLSLACFVLGLFAYENCWLYPFSLSFWWLLLKKDSFNKTQNTLAAIICSWILLILYFPVRKFIATQWIGDYLSNNIIKLDFLFYLKNALALFGRSFLPPMENKFAIVSATICILFILITMFIYVWKLKKLNSFWWLLFFNWLCSYLFFITLGIDTNGYESERYLYTTSFFLCAWLVYSVNLLPLRQSIKTILFIAVLLYNIIFLNKSVQAFRNAGALAKATIEIVQRDIVSKNVHIQNLPNKGFGVPIFRFGFNKAIKWFNPIADTSKIIIDSKSEFKWNEDIQIVNIPINDTGNYIIHFYAKDIKKGKQP